MAQATERRVSPTQRSLKLMRAEGYTCQVVEHWVPSAKVRRDLFGFIDILCLHPERRVVVVQTTTASNMASRRRKILAHENLEIVQAQGWRVELHGWQKKARWECRREIIWWRDDAVCG